MVSICSGSCAILKKGDVRSMRQLSRQGSAVTPAILEDLATFREKLKGNN